MLRMRGRFTDADVADVARLAMAGLVHTDAARAGVIPHGSFHRLPTPIAGKILFKKCPILLELVREAESPSAVAPIADKRGCSRIVC
jgi:hypothetical protein